MADNRRPTHVVQAKTGRTNAEGKNVYMIAGSAWVTDNGISLKIDQLPVPFDGSLYLAEREDNGHQRR